MLASKYELDTTSQYWFAFTVFFRLRHCSSETGGDDADKNVEADVQPGSAVRAKKAAIARERAEAELEEKRLITFLC